MTPCDGCRVRAMCQPIGREYTDENGVFFKEMDLKHSGTIVPQHAHAYPHTSYLVKGSVLFEGAEYQAPHPFHIPANKMHTFQSLEDDTLVLCVHQTAPVITAEHQIV